MANEVYTYNLDEAADPIVQTLATELTKSGTATGDALAARALKDGSNLSFVPAGATTTTARALLDFLGDTINVKSYPASQAGLVQAIADAKTSGKRLFWPAGTYNTSGSLPDLHNVRSYGPGVIRRGSASVGTCFYNLSPDPKTNDQFIRFFVDPTATNAATNDGLTPETAFATFAQVNAALLNKGSELDGLYRVHLAAGTHTGISLDTRIRFKYPLEVRGADVDGWPNVPTTIIDGSVPIGGESQAGERGIDLSAGHNVVLYDLKVQNYSSGYGLSAAGGTVALANMHFQGNHINVNARYLENITFLTSTEINNISKKTACTISGTGKNGVGFGLLVQFGSQLTANFQNNSFSDTLKVTNCGQGLWFNEGCYGHADHVWVDNCGIGYGAQRGAGNNCDQMRIWNCKVGMDIMAGADPLDNVIDFGETSGNACTVKIRHNGGREFFRWRDTLELRKTNAIDDSSIDLSYDVIGQAETTFWTPMKIKAGDVGPILPAAIAAVGEDTTIAGINYKVVHELRHQLGVVVAAAQSANVVICMYLGSVTTNNLVGFFTLSPGATGTFTEFEFKTDLVSTTVTKNTARRIGAAVAGTVYRRNNNLALRNGSDIPVIFTAKWQAADAGAVISFRTGASWSTFGRCPY